MAPWTAKAFALLMLFAYSQSGKNSTVKDVVEYSLIWSASYFLLRSNPFYQKIWLCEFVGWAALTVMLFVVYDEGPLYDLIHRKAWC